MHVLVVGDNQQAAACTCRALEAAGFRTELVAPTSSNPGCHAEPVEASQSYAAVVFLCDSGAVGRARSPTAPGVAARRRRAIRFCKSAACASTWTRASPTGAGRRWS